MLTTRGWWFLIVVAFLIILGATVLPFYSVVPVLLGLTLLGWFAYEWAMFHVRLNTTLSRLRISRRVVQGGRDVPMVWAGLAFEVRVAARSDGPVGLPLVTIDDRLPVLAQKTDGSNSEAFYLIPDEPARLGYTLKSPTPGVLRFEGVRVRFADLHGFFYHRRFLREATEYLVLPPLADDEGRQRATKRFNTLPPPGVHRIRRPGTGSELLDLRDYRPGDPPKMIAWKPSARRDRLITKEFESDVPVRCVLFLDTSEGMRLGPPGGTPLTRMTAVASSLSQAAAGNRDLVALKTFDTVGSKGSNPARTKLHMINIMRQLAEVASLQPGATGVTPEELSRRATPLAHELYPELMAKKTNTVPLGRLWLPLLEKWYGWVVLFMVLYPVLFAGAIFAGPKWLWRPWVEFMAYLAESVTRRKGGTWVNFLLLPFVPVVVGALFWVIFGIRGWFGPWGRETARRKRLSALFALQDGTGPGGTERLVHDDEAYGARVGRFLQAHQLRCPVPLYDEQGQYRFRCREKGRVLGDALIRGVSMARDNELYVVLADLIDLGDDLAPVLKAARVARSRHHQVLVIVPWPADVPVDEDELAKTKRPRAPAKHKPPPRRGGRPIARPVGGAKVQPLTVVQAGLARQYHESFRKLRRAFGRVGATVVKVNEGDPVQLVLDRLDRLRGMRSRR
jgi:uncharacterized protein (DUF58 family)